MESGAESDLVHGVVGALIEAPQVLRVERQSIVESELEANAGKSVAFSAGNIPTIPGSSVEQDVVIQEKAGAAEDLPVSRVDTVSDEAVQAYLGANKDKIDLSVDADRDTDPRLNAVLRLACAAPYTPA